MTRRPAVSAPKCADFNSLSEEILVEIFNLLPLQDKGRLAQVNQRTANVARTANIFARGRHVTPSLDVPFLMEKKFCNLCVLSRQSPGAIADLVTAYCERPYHLVSLAVCMDGYSASDETLLDDL